MKKIFSYDIGLWLLIAFNAYAIYYVKKQPNSINELYIIFWLQSFFIGIFNIIGMLTFTNRVENSYTVNDVKGNRPGCAAAFFAVHYGGFHFVYFIFLFAQLVDLNQVNWHFIQLSFWAIFAGSILQYFQDKNINREKPVNIGVMFFMPYVRIIPMHLVILLPKFLHISAPLLFIALKTVADIVMHLIYRNFMFKTTIKIE